jgi:hypothetical protein
MPRRSVPWHVFVSRVVSGSAGRRARRDGPTFDPVRLHEQVEVVRLIAHAAVIHGLGHLRGLAFIDQGRPVPPESRMSSKVHDCSGGSAMTGSSGIEVSGAVKSSAYARFATSSEASRAVSGARFQRHSINLSTDVWSYNSELMRGGRRQAVPDRGQGGDIQRVAQAVMEPSIESSQMKPLNVNPPRCPTGDMGLARRGASGVARQSCESR